MLAGSLREFTLPDVFSLLTVTRKTGRLHLSGEADGRVDLRRGSVVHATSDVRRLPLGARLLAAGHLDVDHLGALASAQQRAADGELARFLERAGVPPADVERLLREQIVDAVFDLLRRTDGSFSFEASEAEPDDVGPAFPSEELVAEASERLVSWEALQRRVPDLSLVPSVSVRPNVVDGRIAVSAGHWEVLALVDGVRTVTDIVALTGRGTFATCQVIAGLVDGGVVEIHESGGHGTAAALEGRRSALESVEAEVLGAPAPQARPTPSRVAAAPAVRPQAVERPDADEPATPVTARGRVEPEVPFDGHAGRDDASGATERPAEQEPDAADPGRDELRDAADDVEHASDQAERAAAEVEQTHDEVEPTSEDEPADWSALLVEPVADAAQPAAEAPVGREPQPASTGGWNGGHDDLYDDLVTGSYDAPARDRHGDGWPGGATGDPAWASADEEPVEEPADEAPAQAVEDLPLPPRHGEPVAAREPARADGRPVDRAQVARELASLGLDDLSGLAETAPAPAPAPAQAPAAVAKAPAGSNANSLGRDDEVNRGLLLRLIDGVRGA